MKNAFTPLEKAADFSRRLLPHKADGGSKPPSAQTVREPRSLTGFTLIEVIMVMVILGILAAAGMPAFVASLDSVKIEGAYKQLMQDIKYTQQLAVSRRVTHGISFNPTNETYFVYRQNTSNIVKDPATQKSLSVTYASGRFSGIDLVSTTFTVPSANTLEFYSQGAPSSAGAVTINYRGITKTVSVEANTGRIQ